MELECNIFKNECIFKKLWHAFRYKKYFLLYIQKINISM